MSNPHFYLGTRKKENTLYLIHNKVLDIYKFGITSKPINERIFNYCNDKSKFHFIEIDKDGYHEHKYDFQINDINIIYCKKMENCQEVEKKLMKIINGHRVKLKGQKYPFREHFYQSKLDEVMDVLNCL